MRPLTRKLATAGSALAFAATSLLLASSPASAATSCYGSSCFGLDPATTICQNDARTVSWSDRFGVELRYSPTCRAVWARAGANSDAPMGVWVEDEHHNFARTYTTGQTVWTAMLNDKDIQSHAYGYKEETGEYGFTGWY
ncbi:DUF2690 domain-containing protein [Streptomyces sp. NPDC003863]